VVVSPQREASQVSQGDEIGVLEERRDDGAMVGWKEMEEGGVCRVCCRQKRVVRVYRCVAGREGRGGGSSTTWGGRAAS
jgi:hypothetical protein